MRGKILFVASTASHICHFHLPYLEQLRSDGWMIHVACGGSASDIPHSHRTIPLPLKKSMFSISNLRSALILRRIIAHEGYTAIITHTSLAAFFARIAVSGMNSRPRVINMVHGYLFDNQTPCLRRWLLLLAERVTAPVTDVVITMNRCDHNIAQKYRLGRTVLSIPGVGLDLSRLKPWFTAQPQLLREQHRIPPDAFVLVYPAEFSKRKNQAMLIRALKDLPADVVLALPGEGELLDQCQALARKMDVSKRVIFPGHIDEIGPWYALADAAVSASRSEGLPFHIMEAMCFGLPIAAPRVKGIEDLIQDRKSGLLYPFNDLSAFVQRVLALKENAKLRSELGIAAAEASAPFTLDQVFAQVSELYRNILERCE